MKITTATFYALKTDIDFNSLNLNNALKKFKAKSINDDEMDTFGFVPPFSQSKNLAVDVGNFIFFSLLQEKHILPSSVVNSELNKQIKNIYQSEGRQISSTEKKEIKEALVSELLPRAFTASNATFACIDTSRKLLVINGSGSKVNNLLYFLKKSLEKLTIEGLHEAKPLRHILTSFVHLGVPDDFEVLNDCELKNLKDDSSVIYKNNELNNEEIQHQLKRGNVVVRLSLNWQNEIALTASDDWCLRRIKYIQNDENLDEVQQAAEQMQTLAKLYDRFMSL